MNGKRLSLAAVFLLSLCALWCLQSCSKNNTTSYTTDGTLTATVNGVAFSANSYVIGARITTLVPQLIIQGDSIHNGDTAAFQVAMPYILPVNQAVSVDSSAFVGALGITYTKGSKQYQAYYGVFASHGTVTLSTADTVNHKVAGSFSGVLYYSGSDSVVVTNGAFNSTYRQ